MMTAVLIRERGTTIRGHREKMPSTRQGERPQRKPNPACTLLWGFEPLDP